MRRVIEFSDAPASRGDDRSPVQKMQNWLDQCEADAKNEYDIGDPIVFGRSLVVMYNVEPVEPGE